MLEFLNPGYLAAGGALVSAPIIIHLINRLRFRRVHWAAMEFLLKSQKKNRRRLIIEQLILLLLRCLLVLLLGLLVARFLGFSMTDVESKESLHIVLLDDTLSMNDQHIDKKPIHAFDVAKEKIFQQIVQSIEKSESREHFVVIPLSNVTLDEKYQPTVYSGIDKSTVNKIKEELDNIKATNLHMDLLPGLRHVQKIVAENKQSKITFHIYSDYRASDWAEARGDRISTAMLDIAKEHDDILIRPVDVAHPKRKDNSSYPKAHDNVAITDFRAGTRVAGLDMPVEFSITIKNNGNTKAELHIGLYDDEGNEMLEVNLNAVLPPDSEKTLTFEQSFHPDIKEGERKFLQLMAQLESVNRGPLVNDGLQEDNRRFVSVEIRKKVPILVIDGEAAESRKFPGDSFYLHKAIMSVPGTSYKMVYGDVLAGGVATKALERADLSDYPTMFIMNVRDFNKKQLDNLEKYVKEGGGVAFFMGPNVSSTYYNKNLYRGGEGLFPCPLATDYFPSEKEKALVPEPPGTLHLILRDEQFRKNDYPIFGPVFDNPVTRFFLMIGFPVERYFPVPREEWQLHKKPQHFELATLPNTSKISSFNAATKKLILENEDEKKVANPLDEILAMENFRKYRVAIERHRRIIRNIIDPTSGKKAYHIGKALDDLLKDTGKPNDPDDYPDLARFWTNSNTEIRKIRKKIVSLRDAVRYGPTFAAMRNYGAGKVVAYMSSAGTRWNKLADGSKLNRIYTPIVWETQNFLSSLSEKTVRLVGSPLDISVDKSTYGQKNLKVVQYYHPVEVKSKLKAVKVGEDLGKEDEKSGIERFRLAKAVKPGMYVTKLVAQDDDAQAKPYAQWAYTFNVDAKNEGNLERIRFKIFDTINKKHKRGDQDVIRPGSVEESGDKFKRDKWDMSEKPWFFLLILGVLIAEQALAVHLSFHLRGNQAAPPAAAQPGQTPRAA